MFPFPEAEIEVWKVTESLGVKKLESVLRP